MDMPIESADALLSAATRARAQARSDRAWLWIPTRIFAALTVLSSVSYVDWQGRDGNGGLLMRESAVWFRGWGGNIWPTVYWLTAAVFGTWLSQRMVRRREDRIGVRLGTAAPLLIAVLIALVVARLLVSWSYPGPEILAVPLGLLVLAALERDYRAVVGLVVTVGVAARIVLFNRDKMLFQWVIVAEVAVVALGLLVSSFVARPRGRRGGAAHASRA
ncbi:MAG: hypothetical protein QOF57_251 [Frankiaceae bacterium]|jgi:hypothetical protein|nr:hypothetical protein [Frankiaceae bacterium]